MKFLIKLVVLVIIVYFGYQYFLKDKISLFGPKDLGVKYTQADYQSTHDKFGTMVEKNSSSSASIKDSLVYSGKKDVKISLNSSEITAYLNAETWKYAPLSNLQVKINNDGTAQASGILNLVNLIPYLSLSVSTDEVQKAIDQFHISGNPPFYAQGTVSVINNQVTFNINKLSVSQIPIPANYINENISAVNKFASDRLNSIPNLSVRSLSLTSGQVNLDATVPEKVIKLEK